MELTALDRFFNDNQSLAESTKAGYREVLRELGLFYPGRLPETLSGDEVKAYLASIKNPNTWNAHYADLKRFYQWLGPNFLQGMKRRRRVARVDFLHVTEEHLAILISAAQNLKDKAMIALIFECGFRRGEIVSIRIGDVKFDQYGVMVHCPKGKTGPRTVRGVACAALLAQWIDSHPCKQNLNAPLFCCTMNRVAVQTSHHGKPAVNAPLHVGDALPPMAVYSVIRKVLGWVQKTHPEIPHIYPHLGRHFAATKAAKSGSINTQAMKNRFGWTTNRMPDVYCHLTGADADKQYLASLGIKVDETIEKPTLCPRCHYGNVKGIDYCGRCGAPLTLEVAEKLEEKKDTLSALQKDPDMFAELTKKIKAKVLEDLANDPSILKTLLDARSS